MSQRHITSPLYQGVGLVIASCALPFLVHCGGSGGANSGIPVITKQPANQQVAEGGTATFSVKVKAQPSPTYQWYVGKDPITGATSDTYAVQDVKKAMNKFEYHVVVSNSAGKVKSKTAILTVQEGKPPAPPTPTPVPKPPDPKPPTPPPPPPAPAPKPPPPGPDPSPAPKPPVPTPPTPSPKPPPPPSPKDPSPLPPNPPDSPKPKPTPDPKPAPKPEAPPKPDPKPSPDPTPKPGGPKAGEPDDELKEEAVLGEDGTTREMKGNDWVVSFTASSGGSVKGLTQQCLQEGNDSQCVCAMAEPGYRFNFWTCNDGIAVRGKRFVLPCVKESAHVVAHFVKESACERGDMVPDMMGTDEQGNKVALSEYYGRPIVLALMSEEVPSAREEARHFGNLHTHFLADMGIHSVMVMTAPRRGLLPTASRLEAWDHAAAFGGRVQTDATGVSGWAFGKVSQGGARYVLINEQFKVAGVFDDIKQMVITLARSPQVFAPGVVQLPKGITLHNLPKLMDQYMK